MKKSHISFLRNKVFLLEINVAVDLPPHIMLKFLHIIFVFHGIINSLQIYCRHLLL